VTSAENHTFLRAERAPGGRIFPVACSNEGSAGAVDPELPIRDSSDLRQQISSEERIAEGSERQRSSLGEAMLTSSAIRDCRALG
jgi:hypothetical protein